MKRQLFHWYNRVLSILMALLGFGSSMTSCIRPAMYGPDTSDNLDVDPTYLEFDYEAGEEKEIKITTSGKWAIFYEPSFFEVSSTAGKGTSIVYVVTTETNNSLSSRKNFIYIGNEGYQITVPVMQKEKTME